ncbi:hypothetical protein, variant [Cladophialophora immunda]|uniref:Uncharacterized protein n=1 Tax=Cladophialophora immunda TaxID=569365 RepID=A0A0D2AAZ5_9EURO|nr:uncharacterized protein PV07_12654 [Cladophialophora immunda]XP_016242153.1 hypothetical protein, variant [Cladophialophora immunda]KIW21936.1 hypothetical protein PV07_12654 [Cladophialophora immunda]KIW21937.1 hypothetical protein, variant [Cladophialophora immunda]
MATIRGAPTPSTAFATALIDLLTKKSLSTLWPFLSRGQRLRVASGLSDNDFDGNFYGWHMPEDPDVRTAEALHMEPVKRLTNLAMTGHTRATESSDGFTKDLLAQIVSFPKQSLRSVVRENNNINTETCVWLKLAPRIFRQSMRSSRTIGWESISAFHGGRSFLGRQIRTGMRTPTESEACAEN